MPMVNLATEKEPTVESYTENPYGYGTVLCLTEEQVEKLGLDKNPPPAGSKVSLRAIAVVKRVTTEYDPAEEAAEGENPEHIDVAIELQITDLEVAGQRPDVATILYG